MISTALFLLLLPCLLLSLPSLKRWLKEKREAGSNRRTFKYRMPAKERALREKILAQHVERNPPAVYFPDVGAIWLGERPRYRSLLLQSFPPMRPLMRADYEDGNYAVEVVTVSFNYLMIRYGSLDGDIGYTLVVDEDDRAGLDDLCRALDRKLECL